MAWAVKQSAHLLRERRYCSRCSGAAACIGNELPFVDAHACFVRFEIVARQEPHVIRRHDRHAVRHRKLQRTGNALFLARAPGALQLEVIAIAEQRQPGLQCGARLASRPRLRHDRRRLHAPRQRKSRVARIQPRAAAFGLLPFEWLRVGGARSDKCASLAQQHEAARFRLVALARTSASAIRGLMLFPGGLRITSAKRWPGRWRQAGIPKR
jgi:hypothetical protein